MTESLGEKLKPQIIYSIIMQSCIYAVFQINIRKCLIASPVIIPSHEFCSRQLYQLRPILIINLAELYNK